MSPQHILTSIAPLLEASEPPTTPVSEITPADEETLMGIFKHEPTAQDIAAHSRETDWEKTHGARMAKRRELLGGTIKDIRRGLEAGAIPKVTYDQAKAAIGRAIEDALYWPNTSYSLGGDPNDPKVKACREAIYKLPSAYGALHRWNKIISSYAAFAAEIAKIMGPDHRASAVAAHEAKVVKAFAPIAGAIAFLKDKVTKGRAPSSASTSTRYVAPRASLDTMKRMNDTITQVTDAAYEALKKDFLAAIERQVQRYFDLRTDSKQSYFQARKEHKELRDIRDMRDFLTVDSDDNWVKARDYDEKAGREAAYKANEIRKTFASKMTTKLSAIIEKKSSPIKETKIGHIQARSGTFEASIRFVFEDGSAFTVNNSVVQVWSSWTAFQRYPTTFHDVVMPDGSKMKTPSEEKMNKQFTDQTEAADE